MIMAEPVNFKTMINSDLKAQLDKLLERKELSLTAFVENVVRWYLDQDDIAQSMIAGQLTPTPDLIRMVKFGGKPPLGSQSEVRSPTLDRLISGSHVSGSNRGGTRPRSGGR